MPLARQKRVGGVSRLVATGRNRSLLAATGRDWSQPVTQPVVIGRNRSRELDFLLSFRADWSSCASCNRSQSVATGRDWSRNRSRELDFLLSFRADWSRRRRATGRNRSQPVAIGRNRSRKLDFLLSFRADCVATGRNRSRELDFLLSFRADWSRRRRENSTFFCRFVPIGREGVVQPVVIGRDCVATGRNRSQPVVIGHATGRGNSTSFCRFAPIGRAVRRATGRDWSQPVAGTRLPFVVSRRLVATGRPTPFRRQDTKKAECLNRFRHSAARVVTHSEY